jgi:hypothetical protein
MTTETYTTRRVQEITPALAIEAGLRGIKLTTGSWAPVYTPDSGRVERHSEHMTITEKIEPKLVKSTVGGERTGYEHWTTGRLADAIEVAAELVGDGVSIEKYIRLATEGKKRGLTVPAPAVAKPKVEAPRPARKAPAADLDEGTYQNEDQVIRVTRSREGRLYGKIWEGTTFEYRPGLLKGLTSDMLMTLDEAKAFGKQYGTCCICAKVLTKTESIDKGIGPICEGKFG